MSDNLYSSLFPSRPRSSIEMSNDVSNTPCPNVPIERASNLQGVYTDKFYSDVRRPVTALRKMLIKVTVLSVGVSVIIYNTYPVAYSKHQCFCIGLQRLGPLY